MSPELANSGGFVFFHQSAVADDVGREDCDQLSPWGALRHLCSQRHRALDREGARDEIGSETQMLGALPCIRKHNLCLLSRPVLGI